MAKNTRITLTGTAMYAKVFEHNRDMEGYEGAYEDCGGATTIQLVMTPQEYAKLQQAGTRRKANMVIDDDGNTTMSVNFDRKFEVRNRKTGKIIPNLSGPPKVVDKDNYPWDDSVLIGNGSEVELTVNVNSFNYKDPETGESKVAIANRLDGVKVLELVEYIPDDDNIYGQPEEKEEDDTKKAPSKRAARKKVEEVEEDIDLDDEIPF